MPPSDPSGLLDRLREIGPLGERFARAAGAALERAASLPEPERRRVQAAVLAAGMRDAERIREMARVRDTLQDLKSQLDEVSARLREATDQASASLERLEDLRRRLRTPPSSNSRH